jgi:hypothetical protein
MRVLLFEADGKARKGLAMSPTQLNITYTIDDVEKSQIL